MKSKIKKCVDKIYTKFCWLFRVHRKEVIARLIKDNNYKSFIEVGAWCGEVSKHLLNNTDLDKIICIDNYLFSFDM